MPIKFINRLAYLCLALPLVALAQSTATVTILEGEAVLLRGTTRYALVEGVRLAPRDIVQTGDKTFAQVEFADGSRAELGGKTRFLNAVAPLSRGPKAGGASDHFLLSGLVKFSAGKSANASCRYATPQFTVTTSESVGQRGQACIIAFPVHSSDSCAMAAQTSQRNYASLTRHPLFDRNTAA